VYVAIFLLILWLSEEKNMQIIC